MLDESVLRLIAEVTITAQKKKRDDLWTLSEDDLLRELWPLPGMAAYEIGRRMTPPRTKNSIIGRARRLHLPFKKQRAGAWGNVAVPAQTDMEFNPMGMQRKDPHHRKRRVRLVYPELPLFPEPQNYTPIGVPLLDTRYHHCRAIIESSFASASGQAICCGHDVVPGQNFRFCSHHLKAFTQKPRRR